MIAGPNGAGKSTIAPALLRDELGLAEFVNADVIARGLNGFASERVAMQAGPLMLGRLHDLASLRANFAFETTLASRTFAPFLRRLQQDGYFVHLAYVWVPSAAVSVQRVAARVRAGGHHVPDNDIRRRYGNSLKNLFQLSLALADEWRVVDNSGSPATLVASGQRLQSRRIYDPSLWEHLEAEYGHGRNSEGSDR